MSQAAEISFYDKLILSFRGESHFAGNLKTEMWKNQRWFGEQQGLLDMESAQR